MGQLDRVGGWREMGGPAICGLGRERRYGTGIDFAAAPREESLGYFRVPLQGKDKNPSPLDGPNFVQYL